MSRVSGLDATVARAGRAAGFPASLALAALLGSCSLWRPGETWSFALTAEMVEEIEDWDYEPPTPSTCSGSHSGRDWGVLLCAFAPVVLPLAFDLVLLPVTCTHDLCVD
jgi:hypothetical protein